MKSLRAKILALLIGAMMLVIVIASGLAFLLHQPDEFDMAIDSLAAQTALILELKARAATPSTRTSDADGSFPMDGRDQAEGGGPRAKSGFRDAPLEGRTLDGPSQHWRQILRRHGVDRTASVVVEPKDGSNPVVMVPDGPGSWLIVPIMIPPPRNLPQMIAAWLLVVCVGMTAVVIVAVGRITRPLALVERAISDVGADGELPVLPETGPTEIRSTARIINRLSSRLKSAMESRMRLVAAAGHDFRTPLTRMRLRAEFLCDEDREAWLADLDELDRIADSAIRLVQEEAGGGAKQVCRLDVLLNEIVAELKALRLDVAVAVMEPVVVCGGALSLKRALRNLMINGATHGGGCRVTLSVEGDSARIIIEDRGPGIPDSLLHRACEPFFRVDGARRSPVPGAGLGLAIAREIIARSSGELKLSNRLGGGLSQEVRIPMAEFKDQD